MTTRENFLVVLKTDLKRNLTTKWHDNAGNKGLFALLGVVIWFFLVMAPLEVTNNPIMVFAMIEGSIPYLPTKMAR